MGCGKINHYRAGRRSMRNKVVHRAEQETDKYTEEDSEIDTMNTDFINSHAKSLGFTSKIEN